MKLSAKIIIEITIGMWQLIRHWIQETLGPWTPLNLWRVVKHLPGAIIPLVATGNHFSTNTRLIIFTLEMCCQHFSHGNGLVHVMITNIIQFPLQMKFRSGFIVNN